MRLHSLQHVAFEDLSNIGEWAKDKGHAATRTLFFENETLPSVDDFDWLVIMGGPMSAGDESEYPWLTAEKKFIKETVAGGKPVVGICLGAQLLAEGLGGKVFKNRYNEMGWHPVSLTEEGKKSPVFGAFPSEFTAFHWHGDTFDLPSSCTRLAGSAGCANQAFAYGRRVLGLQFHLESSPESIQALIKNCGGGVKKGKYVQTAQSILAETVKMRQIREMMNQLLDNFEKTAGGF